MRVIVAVVCAGGVPLLWAGPASGQGTLTVTPSATPPGGAVTISGVVPSAGAASCPSGDSAQLTSMAALFPPDGFGPLAARDSSGAFRVSYTVPATTPAGTYSIVVRCGGANTGISASLQVVAAASATTSSPASTTTSSSPRSVTTSVPPTSPTSPTVTALPAPAAKKSSRAGWLVLGVAGAAVAAAAAAILVRRHRAR